MRHYEGTPLDRDLISEYSRYEDISYPESERRIKTFVELIKEKLLTGIPVELRGLGTLSVHGRSTMNYRNLHTGQMERVINHKRVHFKTAVSIKREINAINKVSMMKKFKV